MKTDGDISIQRFELSIQTWMRAYGATLKTKKNYEKRLSELESWDNSNGNEYEHTVKVAALKNLIK